MATLNMTNNFSSPTVSRFAILKATWIYFGQCIQAALLYRSSLAIFVATESVSFAGYIAFWYQAALANPKQTAYTGVGLAAYFIAASFHHAIQDHGAAREVGSDIRMGKLSYTIIRPFPYLLTAIVRSFGIGLTRIALLTPLLIIGVACIPSFSNEFISHFNNSMAWQYPLAIGLAIASAILTRIIIGMLAFDMSQIWGPDTMLIALYFATSGTAYPIDIAPAWLYNFAKWTPTFYMTGFPTLVALGRIPSELFWYEFLRGVIISMVMVSLMSLMWFRGIKRFEAIGI